MKHLVKYYFSAINSKKRTPFLIKPNNFRLDLSISQPVLDALEGIPTETTLSERAFLYFFFKNLWAGRHAVLEVGPFLGGTTRAIAMGMMANPMANSEAKLITFDRFRNYYSTDQLKGFLQGRLDSQFLQSLSSDGFLQIFNKFHEKMNYYHLLEIQDKSLPESISEANGTAIFRAPQGVLFDAVFVDGCKSWYSTKFFMKEVIESTVLGGYFIFQDYGCYTCFWISFFMAVFSDHFQLLSFVDDTYTFRYIKPLSQDQIESHFPDEPYSISIDEIQETFNHLYHSAIQRQDNYAQVFTRLHCAAMLAYTDHKELAKRDLNQLFKTAHPRYHHKIKAALISPTYKPNGRGGAPVHL
ncbi:MAG: hypothetical protein AB7F28_04275 [Candidatus Margulisiibacteriota bacterium]